MANEHALKHIIVRGARTHNLKNLHVDLPRDQLVVITGLSGSGKSSLAFDTLYAEGQRRYVESLSAYARQFLSLMEKPDVDHIEGLSPAISIEQKSTSHNPRSTVGTVTEIYDYLRLLFAKIGMPQCPTHGHALAAQTVHQMVDAVLALPEHTAVMIAAPVIRQRKGEHLEWFKQLHRDGYTRAIIDGVVTDLDPMPSLNPKTKHTVEVIVDRLKVRAEHRSRLAESFETALKLAQGLAKVVPMEPASFDEWLASENFCCPDCGYSLPELSPRLFSFNSPTGACSACDGLGLKQIFSEERVITDRSLSLEDGAILGWDKRNPYYFQMLSSLAKHFKFKLNVPFQSLPAKIRKIVLYGSHPETLRFRYRSDSGTGFEKIDVFEGIIPNLERRYRDTESESVREELSRYLSQEACSACNGDRLSEAARHVFIDGQSLPSLARWSIERVLSFFHELKLTGTRGDIAAKILKELQNRLGFLLNVGLGYLTLGRSADTLSGGEAQRIRLASQIGSALVGVLYILDEPSIGLHQRDNHRLLETLHRLRDLGNTVLVVEHDEDAILSADHVIDMGPGAGVHGGYVVAEGPPAAILQHPTSLTGQYLAGKKSIPVPSQRRAPQGEGIHIRGANSHNLKNINVHIPTRVMTCLTGVSGSGKSTLMNDTLLPLASAYCNGASLRTRDLCTTIIGLDAFDKVVAIDQSPIGRTPRSNPATYTGLFTPIRELFAGTLEARARGYSPGRFSFNVKGGRCEACQGDGVMRVAMHFLSDVYVTCDTCQGKRYHRETLDIVYKGRNIHEVLDMTIEDALAFFDSIPVVARKLQVLMEVGLGYLRLGQSAITLSGGEAQRIKLAKELSRRDTGDTLYLLDEPTTGLHFHDIQQLLTVLHRLCDAGNTMLIIEHNLDVIKTADWIIDLGPEGGDHGGEVIATGTPEDLARHPLSHTGRFLKSKLEAQVLNHL